MMKDKSPEKKMIQEMILDGGETHKFLNTDGFSDEFRGIVNNLIKLEYVDVLYHDKYRITLKLTQKGREFGLK